MRSLVALALLVLLAPPALAQTPDLKAKLVLPSTLAPGGKGTVIVELTLGPHWHVNSHTPSEDFLIPTDVALSPSAGTLSPVRYPKHVERRFSFSEKPLRVYEGTVRFEADLQLPPAASGTLELKGSVSYQACNDSQCFAPATLPLQAAVPLRR